MGDEFKERLIEAEKSLISSDPVLRPIIERVGHCTIKPHSNYYQELVEAIIGQQLSIKAAATIVGRFKELGADGFPQPQEVVDVPDDYLRGVGLSWAKISYVKDLATHVLESRLELEKFPSMTNEEIMIELTDVKGIGEWTAHMFLIFSLGRLDILPAGDLGIRKGIQALYGLDNLPDDLEIRRVAEKYGWTGYESVASWYVWKATD